MPNRPAATRSSSLGVVTDPTEVKINNGVDVPKVEGKEPVLKIEMPAKTEEPAPKTEELAEIAEKAAPAVKKEEAQAVVPPSFLLEDPNAGALEP